MTKRYLFSLVGQWALFIRCGPLLLSTRGGGIGIFWQEIHSHVVLTRYQVRPKPGPTQVGPSPAQAQHRPLSGNPEIREPGLAGLARTLRLFFDFFDFYSPFGGQEGFENDPEPQGSFQS